MGSCVFAHANYLLAQVTAAPNTVPDALGTTVLTVGGGGLVVALAAISKDFWSYKRQQIESEERQEKERRESQERLETARLAIERMRISQAKNDRLTNSMLDWMVRAHETKSFPPPPSRVKLSEDTRHGQ